MTDDHIAMEVPATATSSPLIRLAAAQLAAQSGFDHDQVEDIRIAVSEAVRILIGAPAGLGGGADTDRPRLVVDFVVGEGSIAAVVRLDAEAVAVGVDDDSTRILEATTTGYAIDLAGRGAPGITMHFTRGDTSGDVREPAPEHDAGREG